MRLSGDFHEQAFAKLLGQGYRPARGVDFLRADGRRVIELKTFLQGARDLRAAALSLAMYLRREPGVELATLVTSFPRMSRERLRKEWDGILSTLHPDFAHRLGLVAITTGEELALPAGDEETERLLAYANQVLRPVFIRSPNFHREAPQAQSPWNRKGFEVWKALLDAWLRNEPPLAMRELAHRSGTSYPTVAAVVRRMQRERELIRTTSGGAQLVALPRRTLEEILVLAPQLRRSKAFRDATGRAPDPEWLLRRLAKRAPRGIRIGGVAAARHYDPGLDLHGLPRVDVLVDQRAGDGWWTAIDPALEIADPSQPSVVLVAHESLRPPGEDLPFASPAETLLDLHALRLHEQAAALVTRLRKR